MDEDVQSFSSGPTVAFEEVEPEPQEILPVVSQEEVASAVSNKMENVYNWLQGVQTSPNYSTVSGSSPAQSSDSGVVDNYRMELKRSVPLKPYRDIKRSRIQYVSKLPPKVDASMQTDPPEVFNSAVQTDPPLSPSLSPPKKCYDLKFQIRNDKKTRVEAFVTCTDMKEFIKECLYHIHDLASAKMVPWMKKEKESDPYWKSLLDNHDERQRLIETRCKDLLKLVKKEYDSFDYEERLYLKMQFKGTCQMWLDLPNTPINFKKDGDIDPPEKAWSLFENTMDKIQKAEDEEPKEIPIPSVDPESTPQNQVPDAGNLPSEANITAVEAVEKAKENLIYEIKSLVSNPDTRQNFLRLPLREQLWKSQKYAQIDSLSRDEKNFVNMLHLEIKKRHSEMSISNIQPIQIVPHSLFLQTAQDPPRPLAPLAQYQNQFYMQAQQRLQASALPNTMPPGGQLIRSHHQVPEAVAPQLRFRFGGMDPVQLIQTEFRNVPADLRVPGMPQQQRNVNFDSVRGRGRGRGQVNRGRGRGKRSVVERGNIQMNTSLLNQALTTPRIQINPSEGQVDPQAIQIRTNYLGPATTPSQGKISIISNVRIDNLASVNQNPPTTDPNPTLPPPMEPEKIQEQQPPKWDDSKVPLRKRRMSMYQEPPETSPEAATTSLSPLPPPSHTPPSLRQVRTKFVPSPNPLKAQTSNLLTCFNELPQQQHSEQPTEQQVSEEVSKEPVQKPEEAPTTDSENHIEDLLKQVTSDSPKSTVLEDLHQSQSSRNTDELLEDLENSDNSPVIAKSEDFKSEIKILAVTGGVRDDLDDDDDSDVEIVEHQVPIVEIPDDDGTPSLSEEVLINIRNSMKVCSYCVENETTIVCTCLNAAYCSSDCADKDSYHTCEKSLFFSIN